MPTNLQFGKADLHVHSKYSYDAFSPLKKILKKAQERELNLIAITDHNTIKGAKEAQKIAKDFNVEVIIGEEIDTIEGDLIALFIKNFITPGKTALETARAIHKQGGLVVIPHPANWLLGGISSRDIFKIFDQMDGLELFNGSWVGRMNQKRLEKLNNEIFNLAPIAGSDAHLVRQVGRAYTVFSGQSSLDLYNSIKNKTTRLEGTSWNWIDDIFWLINQPKRIFKSPSAVFNDVKELFAKIRDIKRF